MLESARSERRRLRSIPGNFVGFRHERLELMGRLHALFVQSGIWTNKLLQRADGT